MRLLQLHEYLALLDGQAARVSPPPDQAQLAAWLDDARRLWPELRLQAWEASPRRIESVTRCEASGERLVHVTADHKDCFLILVVPPDQVAPAAHILFDIGAEYREIYFNCPAFGVDDPVHRDMITDLVPRLGQESDPFAILEKTETTYLQIYADGPRYSVEHQLVSLACHYQLESTVSADAAVALMTSYAFGRYEWARDWRWVRQTL